ncbi:MAG: nucleotide pyrophosphohydrolase [Verrucomicrobia bacterium]|nr:nucleotide pyrophosphohydrolase [Verrucomicrobiota bacterium]
MKKTQERVAVFVKRNGLETDVPHRMLDVISELGEVAKEVLKGSDYGSKGFVPNEEFQGELGDVLFSLMCIANSTGVDLETAIETALNKYEKRVVEAGSPSSSNES